MHIRNLEFEFPLDLSEIVNQIYNTLQPKHVDKATVQVLVKDKVGFNVDLTPEQEYKLLNEIIDYIADEARYDDESSLVVNIKGCLLYTSPSPRDS